MTGTAPSPPAPSLPALAAAALAILVPLALPDRPMPPRALLASPPLEFPLILLALVLLRPEGAATRVLRAGLTLWLVALVVLKAGDFGMRSAFNRPFNPVLDLPLLGSARDLLSGAVGPLLAGLTISIVGLLLGLLALLLWRATGVWARLDPPPATRRRSALAAALAAALFLADTARALAPGGQPVDPPGQTASSRLIPQRMALVRQSFAELAAFNAAAAADPFAGQSGLLDLLSGHETLIVFVESYGRTSHDTALYRDTHAATLRAAEPALRAAGFALRSGWLASPIMGGQSWLAHGTLASGLRLDSQTRYGAMLASPRRTLFEIAADEGFRSVAVMPAITLAWPEGRMLGFSEIFAAADLDYRGRPYNWVTMPDQFTLSALDRIRASAPGTPALFQVALISSHAPWTPVPELVPWEDVGDGTALSRWADAGDPPEVVWRDRDRVRDQYRLSIDYALRAVLSHAARQRAPLPLIVVLGDHQPAPFVALSESRDVPVHVIGPPDLVARIGGWGWTEGLLPDPALPAWPMEAFRDRFLSAFSSAGAPG